MTQLKRLSALTLAFLLAFALNVSSAGAQDTVVPDDGSTIQQQQDPSTPGDGQVGGTTDTTNQTFNWWWLLPLLLIPLLFLLARRDADRNDRSYTSTQGYAGTKGGRAQADDDDDLQME